MSSRARVLGGFGLFLLVLVLWYLLGGQDLGLDALRPDRGVVPDELEGTIDFVDGSDRGDVDTPTLEGVEGVTADRGPVEVTLVGPTGLPLLGVPVRLERDAIRATGELEWASTDASGKVTFADVWYDGRARVAVGVGTTRDREVIRLVVAEKGDVGWDGLGFPSFFMPGFNDSRPILGPTHRYESWVGLPIDIDVVKTDDGRRADVGVIAFPCFCAAGGEHPVYPPHAMGELLAAPVYPDSSCFFAVPAPRGYLSFDHYPYGMAVPPRTKRLKIELPVRPEAVVRVVFSEDTPAGWHQTFLPEVAVATMGVDGWKPHLEVDGFGRAYLRKVPFIADARLDVEGSFGASDNEKGAEGAAVFGSDPREEVVVTLSSPLEWMRDHEELDEDVDAEKRSHLDGRGAGAVRVHVLDPDGHPVYGAVVHLNLKGKSVGSHLTTDRDGFARFDQHYPGSYEVVVWGAGAVTTKELALARDDDVEVRVQALRGATIHLKVVDAEGAPISFARFRAMQPSHLEWCDLDDSRTLRIDRFVDVDGERTLHMLEPGRIGIWAWLGNRGNLRELDVVDGGVHDLTLKFR